MLKNFRKAQNKIGLAPGSLVYTGEANTDKTFIECVEYNDDYYYYYELDNVDNLAVKSSSNNKLWINIKNIQDVNVIKKVGDLFNINSLTIEDVLNISNLPKIEFFESYIFLILKDTNYINGVLVVKQVSLIIGENFVLSFQETQDDIFKEIKNRLENNSIFKKRGVSYLGYTIIDLIIDTEFNTLYYIGEKVDEYESILLESSDSTLLHGIHSLKRDILNYRSLVIPLRSMVKFLEKEETTIIKDDLKIYIRDLNDHINQLSETIEIYRETTTHLVDVYLSIANNRMSEVMKVLTIIATIFIPLTFLAGVYGMNFKYMPELDYKYSYYILLAIMFIIFIGMLAYFRRKKWL